MSHSSLHLLLPPYVLIVGMKMTGGVTSIRDQEEEGVGCGQATGWTHDPVKCLSWPHFLLSSCLPNRSFEGFQREADW